MKTKFTFLIVLVLALVGLAPIVGISCKNPNQSAYRVVGTVQVSADVAMRAWGDYVHRAHPSIEAEQKVKTAYDRYRAAAIVVTDAGKALAQVDSPAGRTRLDIALAEASASLGDLTNLIESFGIKLK